MHSKHIPLIMEIIDKIVSQDERKRKYSNRQIMKILVLLNIFGISYRSAGIFLRNHEEYLNMIDLKEIPSFQTLSRRARSFDLHALDRKITCEHSMNECAAMDSFMIHTCKYSTAVRRKLWGNYKDHESGWSKTTKGWSYGRKCHVSMDVDSCIIREWIVTKGNIHDSKVSHDLIDSVRNYTHILADSAYDTSEIYDYIFDNTHSMPVVDTNKRRGIRSDRLTMNRMIGIDLRKEYSSLYSLRWEIERTFSILEEMLHCENMWYNMNRSYDHAIGFKITAYNLMVISNILSGERPRKIKRIVSC